MKAYNTYIISLALLLLGTTVVMIASGLKSLQVYYTVYIAEALALTELNVYLNAKARRGLALVSGLLFISFLPVVLFLIISVLA